MGNRCLGTAEVDTKSNFTFLTRSISLSRLGSEIQLNRQGLHADVLEAVKKAEVRNDGLPVSMHQIWRSFDLNSSLHSNKFKVVLLDLFKQGEIYADQSVSLFTTNARFLSGHGDEHFYSCKDLLYSKCDGYKLSKIEQRIVAREDTSMTNFVELKELLLSADMSRYDEFAAQTNRQFLNGEVSLSSLGHQVAIQSFQGAGNDLLGRLVETVTQVYCGADSNCHYTFDLALGAGDFGVQHTGQKDQVWFTRTNHPIDSKSQEFSAQKLICIVRNPMDTIKVTADAKNLFSSGHGLTVKSNYQGEELIDWWRKWTIIQAQNMEANHSFVLKELSDKMPTLFIRYEDLVRDPRQGLTEVFKLTLDVDSLEGTILERRIREVSEAFANPDAPFCTSADQFSRMQKNELAEILACYATYFGYNLNQVETALSTEISAIVNQEAAENEATVPALIEYFTNSALPSEYQNSNKQVLKQEKADSSTKSHDFSHVSLSRRSQKPYDGPLNIVRKH